MNRWLTAMLVVVALVAGFFLGRYSRESRAELSASTPAGVEALRPGAVVPGDEASNATAKTQPVTANVRPRPALPAEVETPVAGQPPRMAAEANTGPQPLSEEGQAWLRDWTKKLAAQDAGTEDLPDLSEREAADADAAYLEDLIATAIRRHGAAVTGLQLSPPHCTRTVCSIRGIGSERTQDPRSDWQSLLYRMIAEPWFREHFVDLRTSVGGEGRNTFYVTFFVRK